MKDLEKFFYGGRHNLIHKWAHYFEIYDRHFSHLRGKELNILEIGAAHGGSLEMWRDYFGDKCTIYSIDINPECKQFENDYTKVFIGSQDNVLFLREIGMILPKIDILIDDGGHTMKQQINTLNELFWKVRIDGGIYVCEDTHTSYMKQFGSRFKISFLRKTATLIDSMHRWHINKVPDKYTTTVKSIHYYDSIVVIEKGNISRPYDVKRGAQTINDPHFESLIASRL